MLRFWRKPRDITKNIIVLKEHGIAYVRIPKVANSSIKSSLARLTEGRVTESHSYGATSDKYWKKSAEAEFLSTRDFKALYPDFFCFSFVRNPFDRVVACYNNKVIENEDVSRRMKSMGVVKRISFTEFVNSLSKTPDVDIDVHLRSQATILTDANGAIFPDFIGYLETMSADWTRLNEALKARGLTELGDLPSVNVRRGDKEDLVTYYTSKALRQLVFDRYRKDFELFYPDERP